VIVVAGSEPTPQPANPSVGFDHRSGSRDFRRRLNDEPFHFVTERAAMLEKRERFHFTEVPKSRVPKVAYVPSVT